MTTTDTDELTERIGRILGVHEPGEYDECEDCRRAVAPIAARIATVAHAHLAAQEPTDAEVGHAYAEWMNHSPIIDLDARRINCTCGECGFTPPGYEHHRLRAALTAARTTRRDKEKRDD